MLVIPPLTQELLGALGREIKGCTFTNASQMAFLSSGVSCDVQAAPGNGKTTLLAAKLALLSRTWTSRAYGVCVISHTNAAREEVEKKLAAHPAASAFLSYPHFIGTVTAFVDKFIALPYLRGLGWSVQRIDDEVFAAVAARRFRSKPTLLASSRRQEHAVRRWVSLMDLDVGFDAAPGVRPIRLAIRNKGDRQPGARSASGIELEELKAELVTDGFYRFADMTAIAQQALEKCPELVERVRRRFPLVLLDEAQDTNGPQLALINRIFAAGVVYQRLGDQNQTLYEDDSLTPDDYWRTGNDVIPLNETRRFGTAIAAFASRLTARAAQEITGLPDVPNRRSLLLFDQASIGRVLPTYADEVRAHWRERPDINLDVWAVASRHNPSRDPRGNWPKTLVDYCPEYRSGKTQGRPDSLCASLRHAAIKAESNTAVADIVEILTIGIVDLLRHQGVRDGAGRAFNKRNVWSYLAARDAKLPMRVRRLFLDRVIHGRAAWAGALWAQFCDELKALLFTNGAIAQAVTAFLEFIDEGAAERDEDRASRTVFVDGDVSIQLGSIHSVKGKTVDSILILETEVFRSSGRDGREMDLATVLPHALGVENADFSNTPARLAAATNVFVAATRARQLLACAVRKEAASGALVAAAQAQGWNVVDITDVENG